MFKKTSKIFLFLMLLGSVVALASCDNTNGDVPGSIVEPAKEYWTVTIDLNDGSATSTKEVEKGQKLTGVTDPTRDGYTFDGWKVNGEAWSMDTAVTADIKIVAQWKENAVIDNRVEYVVTVKGVSGKPLSGFIVYFTNPLDSSFSVTPKMTDGKGEAKFTLDPNNYQVRIVAENGWYFDDDETSYVTTVTKDSRNVSVECTSKLIEGENPGLVTAGSPAYDFTVKTVDGKEWNLKEQLETYDLVVLNFWYTTCTYCLLEFPYLNDAWNDYQDKVALIGLNNGSDDTTQDVIGFQEAQGLSFPLALDSSNVAYSYVTVGYPTTVFIDRYGTADYIESGAITSKDKWTKLFDSYLGDDYVPTYKGSATDEEEREIPDVEMSNPDDIAKLVNGEGFNGVFGNYESETDGKWNWPWIIDEENEAIIPSNSFKNNSFSIFTLTTSMKKNQVLSFDYRCAVDDSDILYILSDNRIISELTGYYKDYKTHHLFVAPRDGEYTFSFCYMKDGILSDNIDKIFLKNFRYTTTEDITDFIYMLRDCSYGQLLFDSYEYYEEVVFNQKDGYYHIGIETGPLVFADLFNQTHFSSTPILTYFSDEEFLTNNAGGKKIAQYKEIINEYASYANDSVVGGYVPVTEDLAQALKAIAEVLGAARGNDDAWLEMCVYFNVYGPTDDIDYIDSVTKEIINPIKGLAPFDCFEVVEDDITTPKVESTVQLYDRVLISRGYLFKFVPEHTGVYLFYSLGNVYTNCIIYNADMKFYASHDDSLKYYTYGAGLTDENYRGYAYFVAGETYYVKPYFEDVYSYEMNMEFVFTYTGETSFDVLTICSEWPFTTRDNLEGSLDSIESNLITVGINAALGEDGYYHEKYKDGTLSEKKIYVDFDNFFEFGYSLADMISMKAFDFTKTETGLPVFDEEGYLIQYYYDHDEDGNTIGEMKSRRRTDKNGNPLMKTEMEADWTERVREIYTEKVIHDGSELDGCIAVDEEMCKILQALMDKYTFYNVKDSWQKCCYYYKNINESSVN